MIDYTDSTKVLEISEELLTKSKEYHDARRKAAVAKWKLDLILASKMKEFRVIRTNLGYESARVMLLEDNNDEINQYYKEEEKWSAEYKGLEKIIDALQSQISLCQSLIKNRIKESVT